jgi:hypothetical protein
MPERQSFLQRLRRKRLRPTSVEPPLPLCGDSAAADPAFEAAVRELIERADVLDEAERLVPR